MGNSKTILFEQSRGIGRVGDLESENRDVFQLNTQHKRLGDLKENWFLLFSKFPHETLNTHLKRIASGLSN